jgi:hypothetical protein
MHHATRLVLAKRDKSRLRSSGAARRNPGKSRKLKAKARQRAVSGRRLVMCRQDIQDYADFQSSSAAEKCKGVLTGNVF